MQFLKYIYTILFACIIFYLCVMQLPDKTPPAFQVPDFDKIVHILMYFGLTGILFTEYFKHNQTFTWSQTWNFLVKRKTTSDARPSPISTTHYLLLSLLPLFYGGAIEIIQEKFTTTRSGDWLDFLADFVGVSLSFLLFLVVKHNRCNRL